MFERIVVGYAGDRAGRDGVLLASQLAHLTGASVTVVFPYHPLFAALPADLAEERARDELRAMLGADPLVELARFHWSNASWPIRALHELAEYERADLVVFGAAPVRIGRRRIGLMERMVHGAPCAVAVAPEGYADSERRALQRFGVGLADTGEGHAAARTAVELARAAGGRLKVVAAWGLSGALAAYASRSPALPDAEHELFEKARSAAEHVARAAWPDDGFTLDLRHGDPCDALLDAAGDLDLLVLGSRGYGPLGHALLGGVSADVMRAARCPVLVLARTAVRDAELEGRATAVAAG